MTPPEVASTILDSLIKIAREAPGFLAVFSGQKDDADALESARLALEAIPLSPARAGIDRRRAELAAQGSKIELVHAVYRGILRATETRAALAAIPMGEGEALIPVEDAARHLDTLIDDL
jgi:hypothetical protein